MKTLKDVMPECNLSSDELSSIAGGRRQDVNTLRQDPFQQADGCYTGICSQKLNPKFCEGGAICTSGIAGE